MQRSSINAAPREGIGKGVARKLRAQGRIPAVLYGSGVQPTNLSVDAHELDLAARHGANAVFDLKGDGLPNTPPVLIKELQRDPVKRTPVHCDFYAVNVREEVEVEVSLHFEGTPEGVKLEGGVMEPLLRELRISCLPLSIPDQFNVDVSALKIGDTLHVRDVVVPDGVTVLDEVDQAIVHVVPPRVEETAAPAEGAAAAEGAAPAAGAEGAKAGEKSDE